LWSLAKVSKADEDHSNIASVFANNLCQCKYGFLYDLKFLTRMTYWEGELALAMEKL